MIAVGRGASTPPLNVATGERRTTLSSGEASEYRVPTTWNFPAEPAGRARMYRALVAKLRQVARNSTALRPALASAGLWVGAAHTRACDESSEVVSRAIEGRVQ